MVSVNQDMAFWGVSTLSAYPDAGDNFEKPWGWQMAYVEKASPSSISHGQSLSPLHLRVLQKRQRSGIAEMNQAYSCLPEKKPPIVGQAQSVIRLSQI
jgi:hypothetical protein